MQALQNVSDAEYEPRRVKSEASFDMCWCTFPIWLVLRCQVGMTVRCYTTLIWRCVCKVNVTCCDDVPKVFWVDPRAERDADCCMAIVSSRGESLWKQTWNHDTHVLVSCCLLKRQLCSLYNSKQLALWLRFTKWQVRVNNSFAICIDPKTFTPYRVQFFPHALCSMESCLIASHQSFQVVLPCNNLH